MDELEYIEILTRVKTLRYGLILACADVKALARIRARFYAIKKNDESLYNIALVTSPVEPTHLWIINKEPNNA